MYRHLGEEDAPADDTIRPLREAIRASSSPPGSWKSDTSQSAVGLLAVAIEALVGNTGLVVRCIRRCQGQCTAQRA